MLHGDDGCSGLHIPKRHANWKKLISGAPARLIPQRRLIRANVNVRRTGGLLIFQLSHREVDAQLRNRLQQSAGIARFTYGDQRTKISDELEPASKTTIKFDSHRVAHTVFRDKIPQKGAGTISIVVV